MSNITLNIVEPASPTPIPVDPGTGTVVPDTGLFTGGTSGAEAAIIATLGLVAILAIIGAIIYYRKHKQGKVSNIFTKCKQAIKAKKYAPGLAVLALLVSIGTVAGLLKLGASAEEAYNIEAQDSTALTVTAESEDLTIELADEPIFAVLPVELTVAEATEAGYTLTAYAESTDLVSATDSSKVIPMVVADEDELVALADNTYGLALVEPENQTDEIYTALSTDSLNPTIIKSMTEYTPTEAEDKTTIYYGFYITPDTPYGTYTGSTINYDADENIVATVTFDSNGLYFDGDESHTTNIMKYEKTVTDKTELYSHTPNVNDEGVQIGGEMYPENINKTFVYEFADAAEVNLDVVEIDSRGYFYTENPSFFSLWSGNHPDYTAMNNWDLGIKEFGSDGRYNFERYRESTPMNFSIEGNIATLSYHTGNEEATGYRTGYGYYAVITAKNAEGNPAYAVNNALRHGVYKTPGTTVYSNYEFLGWSTDPNATSAPYADADDIEDYMVLEENEKVTLYAVWSPIVNINYDGNNATMGSMESTYNGETVTLAHEDVMAGDAITLYAPNYKKTGYGFAGWSTDQNAWNDLTDDEEGNNPTIYGPNQTFVITKDMALDIADMGGESTLYAVWVPAEQNNSVPVSLQNWSGCSNLVATTYNSETGELAVSKNTLAALTDSRDGEVYTVAKLADGNCWIVENLRLDNTAEITTSNTNNPITVSGRVAIKNNNGGTSAYLSLPIRSDWCTDRSSSCVEQSYFNDNNTDFSNGLTPSYNGPSSNSRWYSYGNYYNWYSATAGNGKYSDISVSKNGDICPAGWKLPVGGENSTDGSFAYLDFSMGNVGGYQSTSEASNKWRSFPNNFVISGYMNGGASNGSGNYISSTAGSYEDEVKSLSVSRSGLNTNNTLEKSNGHSVRCLTSGN